jgi:hypothetical protein
VAPSFNTTCQFSKVVFLCPYMMGNRPPIPLLMCLSFSFVHFPILFFIYTVVCLKSNVTFKIFLHNAFYHFPFDLKMYTFVYLKPILSMYFSCGLHLCTLCTHVLAVVQSAASTLCLLLYNKITIWAKQSSGPRQ